MAKSEHIGYRILNIVFLVATIALGIVSAVLTGGGIWRVIDRVSFVSPVVGTTLVYDGSVLVTAASMLTIVVAFVGCFSWRQPSHRLLTIVLSCLLMATMALDWSGAACAIVYKSWVSDQMRNYMRDSLQTDYGRNGTRGEMITEEWDSAQEKWYCCGVEDSSWGVYRNSYWFNLQPDGTPDEVKLRVPLSCCRKDQYGRYIDVQKCQTWQLGPPGKVSGYHNEAIHYKGCFEASKLSLDKVADNIILKGILMYFAVLSLFVASCFNNRHKSSK